MQGRKRGEGMSKSEVGLQNLGQGSWIRVWNGEGRAGSSMQSSENRTKVCGWMGYAVGDLRMSSGYRYMWIGVLVWCYMECNSSVLTKSLPKPPDPKRAMISKVQMAASQISKLMLADFPTLQKKWEEEFTDIFGEIPLRLPHSEA